LKQSKIEIRIVIVEDEAYLNSLTFHCLYIIVLWDHVGCNTCEMFYCKYLLLT